MSSEVRSDRERAAPSALDKEVAGLVDGNSDFAFDLYQALGRQSVESLLFAPQHLPRAVHDLRGGRRTDGKPDGRYSPFPLVSRLHPAFNALAQQLASRGEVTQGRGGVGFRLNIVNAVWGQQGHDFREPFLDVLADSYGAGVRSADFRVAPEESRLAINDWVAENTEDRIRDLIPPDG